MTLRRAGPCLSCVSIPLFLSDADMIKRLPPKCGRARRRADDDVVRLLFNGRSRQFPRRNLWCGFSVLGRGSYARTADASRALLFGHVRGRGARRLWPSSEMEKRSPYAIRPPPRLSERVFCEACLIHGATMPAPMRSYCPLGGKVYRTQRLRPWRAVRRHRYADCWRLSEVADWRTGSITIAVVRADRDESVARTRSPSRADCRTHSQRGSHREVPEVGSVLTTSGAPRVLSSGRSSPECPTGRQS